MEKSSCLGARRPASVFRMWCMACGSGTLLFMVKEQLRLKIKEHLQQQKAETTAAIITLKLLWFVSESIKYFNSQGQWDLHKQSLN